MPQDRHPGRPILTPLQRFLSSRLVTGVGMFLSKHLPPPIGHGIASLIAGLISWLKPDFYWILHANLRQVVGPEVDEETLHRIVRQVFRNNARNNYDLWHLAGKGPEAIRAAVHIPPDAWARAEQARQRDKGVIIVGTHTGNFDLSILALAAHGQEVQILGMAAPPAGGFDLMDQLRERTGAHLTTISPQTLREAISRLRAGGIVLTGVDRPVSDVGRLVEFFGRPAPLPTGHVRLALKTNAAILVAGPYRDSQKGNTMRLSPLLEMIRTGDRDEDLQINLRRVTAWLEEFIRAWPEQWAMFVPVWPKERKQIDKGTGRQRAGI
ncbi:MAG: lysophospholipid acyltransferase family protein [Anaerolineae bacterium]